MKKIKILVFAIVVILGLSSLCFADVMSEISAAVNKWSAHYNFEPELIYAIIEQESNFNPNATGSSRDRGLMQITPIAQADVGYSYLGDNIYDIDTNIMIGTALLAKIRDQYLKSDDIRKILGRYNGSGPYGLYANSVMTRYNNYKNGTSKMPISFNSSEKKNENACTVMGCKGVKVDKWEHTRDTADKGRHYKVCSVNNDHQYPGAEYTWINGICSLCGAKKPSTGSGQTEQNKCTVAGCGGKKVDKWEHTRDTADKGRHYKVCSVNSAHQFPDAEYKVVNGKCNLCGIYMTVKDIVVNNNQTINKNKVFSDVPNDHWAYKEVKAMKEAGIVAGNLDGTLGANDKITAEQFIVLLAQVVQKKGMTLHVGNAYLVNEMGVNDWSYDLYIKLVQVLGNKSDPTKKMGEDEIKLILGNSTEAVLSNYKKPITREKVASLMGAVLEVKYGKDTNITSVNKLGAKDWNKVTDTFKQRINALVEKDIFKGAIIDNSLYINPDVGITRVEAVALIARLYEVL